MAAVLNLIGAFAGEEVAKTVASGIVNPGVVQLETIAAETPSVDVALAERSA